MTFPDHGCFAFVQAVRAGDPPYDGTIIVVAAAVGSEARIIGATDIAAARAIVQDLARSADAVLVEARGSIPDLKATIRRIVRPRVSA